MGATREVTCQTVSDLTPGNGAAEEAVVEAVLDKAAVVSAVAMAVENNAAATVAEEEGTLATLSTD